MAREHSNLEQVRFSIGGKDVTLHRAAAENCPLVVLNNYAGDGRSVVDALGRIGGPELNLLCVGGLNWNHDMAPWDCPPLGANDAACTGGADDYLGLLLDGILPHARGLVAGEPSHTGIAGYSLGGLFALYAMYRCDAFDRAASMSGSLWFPGFEEYCKTHEFVRRPEKVYLSLGDHEARSSNRLLRSVLDRTESIAAHYRDAGINVEWELNPGNHFKQPALRSAKGVRAIAR